jgi:hypothetical protein
MVIVMPQSHVHASPLRRCRYNNACCDWLSACRIIASQAPQADQLIAR